MIDLYLSSDGKHTVHVSAQTPAEIVDLLPEAEAVYDAVVRKYGTKAEMTNGNGNGKMSEKGAVEPAHGAKAPVCPVHHREMAYREGRHGPFWSCPERMVNGAWCTVTKDANGSGNGYAIAQH